METQEISTVIMEAQAAVKMSHRLLDEMRMLRWQVNQGLSAVRKSAATLALNVGAAMPVASAGAAAEPVVLAPPAVAPEATREERRPDSNAAGPRPLDPPAPRPLEAKDQELLDLLTPREIEVLRLIGEGQRTKEIAFTLGITFKTAVTHRSNIMEKLGIHEGPRLVRFAIRTGIVTA